MYLYCCIYVQERCDSYVRLIKLTLDETIREQNILLDGSAIHNRLKRLGVMDKRPTVTLDALDVDNIPAVIYDKTIDFHNPNHKYSTFDNTLRGMYAKKPHINPTEIASYSPPWSTGYNNGSGYKKPTRVRDLDSSAAAVYAPDGWCDNSPRYLPISRKNHGTSSANNVPTTSVYPREYDRVYYFPTSRPVVQYPRQTAERFYKRNPVKQYPVEQAPHWRTRYVKPVRVVEREPYYRLPAVDYDYGGSTHRGGRDYLAGGDVVEQPCSYVTPQREYRPRYYWANGVGGTYRGFDDTADAGCYYEPDVPSFRGMRPCSPVYGCGGDDISHDRIRFENLSGSLLEKKIRDYVWNPHRERIGKYAAVPSDYEKSPYRGVGFKPSSLNYNYRGNDPNKTRLPPLELDAPPVRNRKTPVAVEADSFYYKRPPTPPQTSPEIIIARPNDEYFQSRKDDDRFLRDIPDNTSYNKKPETPVNFTKRISFDLGDENVKLEFVDCKKSVSEKTNPIKIANTTIERKPSSNLGRRESNPSKPDDKRRTSLLMHNNSPVSISKPRVLPSRSRRESLSRPEKLIKIESSRESSNKNSNFRENNLNPSEKNVVDYAVITNDDIERVDYVQRNDVQFRSKRKNSDVRDIARGDTGFVGNDNENRKLLTETIGKSNVSDEERAMKNISNRKDCVKIVERRESHKGEQKFEKPNVSGGDKNSYIETADRLEDEEKVYNNDSSKDSQFGTERGGIVNDNYRAGKEQTVDDVRQATVDNRNNIVDGEIINPETVGTVLPFREEVINNCGGQTTDTVMDDNSVGPDMRPGSPTSEMIVVNNDDGTYGNDDFTNYYQEHPSNDNGTNVVRSMHEPKDVRPEYGDDTFAGDNKEEQITMGPDGGTVQRDGFAGENLHADGSYYENHSAAAAGDAIDGNQYETPGAAIDTREKYDDDDGDDNAGYYYRNNNYSGAEEPVKEQPENRYAAERDDGAEYHGGNDYYDNNYQDHGAGAVDGTEKPRADDLEPYAGTAEPDYGAENYADGQRPPEDEYYYQNDNNNSNNYPDADVKPGIEYVQDNGGELRGDDYYYDENNPAKEQGGTDGNPVDRRYAEPEREYVRDGDYYDRPEPRDDNYYYENNDNPNDANAAAADNLPLARYDQQESYADQRQHAADGGDDSAAAAAAGGYYYQKPDDAVYDDRPAPDKEPLYDGYDGDDQHRANVVADTAYYPEPRIHDNYDPRPVYEENNDYQTTREEQPTEYEGPYEQIPNENEQYDYTAAAVDDSPAVAVDRGQPRNRVPDDPPQNDSKLINQQ